MKRALRLIVSLLLSGFFLWLTFRKVDVKKALDLLHDVRLPYVGLYVLSLAATQLCRVVRWDVLIRPFARVSRAALFRIGNVGMMLVLLLPLRLGELARPYLLKKETGAPLSAGMGSVVVERAIDGLLVTLLFFVCTLTFDPSYHVSPALVAGAYAALAVFASATVVVLVALVARDTALKIVRKVGAPISPRLADRAAGMLDAFVTGLRALPNARSVAVLIAWTVAYWAVNGLGLWSAMQAFGWDLPVSAGFTLVSVIVIGIMIPAGPGFLGTYQAAIAAGLAIYGIGENEAAAYGLVVYPLNVLVCCAFGLPYFFAPRHTAVSEIVNAAPDNAG